MNVVERALRRLELLTLPATEATTATWNFVNDQDVIFPQRCSGDPAHGEIVTERKILGKREKTITAEEARKISWGQWAVTNLVTATLLDAVVLSRGTTKEQTTVKLEFNHSVPYCADCYRGVRRTLNVRLILIILALVSLPVTCVTSFFEWGLIPFLLGVVCIVGVIPMNLIRNQSQTVRILDFNPLENAMEVTLKFSNPAYAELFILENNIAALKDSRSEARLAAANSLGRIGNFRATLPLVNALNDEGAEVREAASESLMQLNDPKAKEGLLDCLKNSKVRTRLAAIDVLQKQMNDEETAVALISILESDDAPSVRLAAATALAAAGEVAINPLIAALRDPSTPVRIQAAGALRTLAAGQAVPALIAALDDPTPEVKQEAAETLGVLSDPAAVDPLIRILGDRSEGIAQTAVSSLISLAPDQPLIQALHTLAAGEVDARSEAAHTLAELGDPRAVPALRRSLYDSDEAQRGAAAALVRFGPEEALEPLLEALTDTGSGIRALAADALGELADPRAEAPLLQALQDSVAEVRQNAAVALATACSPSFRPAAETIKIIVTGQPEARQTAVRQLVAYEDQRVKDFLIWVLIHDENVQIRTDVARALPQMDVEAIELLIQSLNTPNSDRASEVLIALGSDAVAALTTAVNEHQGAIQQAAIKTLGQIEDDRVENILVEMLQNPNTEPAVKSEAFDALGEIAHKPHLLPVVMQMIGNDQFNARLQKTAVLQLGHTNDPMAAAALVDALDNWSLRHTARDALRQLGDAATDALLARYELEKSKELRRMIGDLLGDKKPASMKGRLFGRKKK